MKAGSEALEAASPRPRSGTEDSASTATATTTATSTATVTTTATSSAKPATHHDHAGSSVGSVLNAQPLMPCGPLKRITPMESVELKT
jgi:hypothetical protein